MENLFFLLLQSTHAFVLDLNGAFLQMVPECVIRRRCHAIIAPCVGIVTALSHRVIIGGLGLIRVVAVARVLDDVALLGSLQVRATRLLEFHAADLLSQPSNRFV